MSGESQSVLCRVRRGLCVFSTERASEESVLIKPMILGTSTLLRERRRKTAPFVGSLLHCLPRSIHANGRESASEREKINLFFPTLTRKDEDSFAWKSPVIFIARSYVACLAFYFFFAPPALKLMLFNSLLFLDRHKQAFVHSLYIHTFDTT